jgi:hypothetical protein
MPAGNPRRQSRPPQPIPLNSLQFRRFQLCPPRGLELTLFSNQPAGIITGNR